MTIYHNSRDEKYRVPFGAVTVGTTVTLALEVFDEMPSEVYVRIWIDEKGEQMLPMNMVLQGNYCRYELLLPTTSADIIWYSFKVVSDTGRVVWYGTKENRTGGLGQTYDNEPPGFQITVYKERKVPDWYKKGIAYQIFPDRFKRGQDWQKNVVNSLSFNRRGPGRSLVPDWYEQPYYKKTPSGAIEEWQFYGGGLSGITEMMDYLKEMGITILYLNPIFEAASNHRYDTGDYMKIDPMLGDEESFKTLCAEAKAHGIRVILDGVFNHTGADSIYFDKFANYQSNGAFNHFDSPYRNWFHFDNSQMGYTGWWGVADLPDVNENDPSFRNMIYEGDDSVVRKWIRAGASGWRLDVADELPDDFIVGIKNAMLEELGEDALLLGEVWEDATNKLAYHKLRRYLLGEELDSTMNYPFREGIISFVTGRIRSDEMAEVCNRLLENYPPENFAACFNLIGSHDRARILTALSDVPEDAFVDEEAKHLFRLKGEQREKAVERLKLAVLMQMTLPGVPVVYYGDEVGMEGFTDPYNRGPYPWGQGDEAIRKIYRDAIELRRSNPIFSEGDFLPMYFNQDVFGIRRRLNGEIVYVLVNKNPNLGYEVKVHVNDSFPVELLSGRKVKVRDGVSSVSVGALSAAVVFCTNGKKLNKELPWGSGVLCPITSLPHGGAPGTIGEDAHAFLRFLNENKQRYWQMLSINETDDTASPMSLISAFACNTRLIGKSREDLQRIYIADRQNIAFETYKENEKSWLREYSMFCALQEKFDYAPWQNWPTKYRRYSEDLWSEVQLESWANYFAYLQFYFDLHWKEVRETARENGIYLIGELPMYVTPDSCDAWAHPELFRLDENGRMTEEACHPADRFHKRRLVEGCPAYHWDAMKAEDYDWWIRRFERAMYLYDYVYLCNFSDFEAGNCLEHTNDTHDEFFRHGPGFELFRKAYERLGELPFIAEDYGDVNGAVRELSLRCGFYCTDVLAFYEGNLSAYDGYQNSVTYVGNRDTDMLKQWCKDRFPGNNEVEEKLLHGMYTSSSPVVIMPLQDAMGLGSEARLNMPGTVTGRNWKWRAADELMAAAGERLRFYAEDGRRDRLSAPQGQEDRI